MNGRGRKWLPGAAAALLVLSVLAAWHCVTGRGLPSESVAAQRLPRIRPDYTQIVIPPNIAPLNFIVEEPGIEYRVRIHGEKGKDIFVGSHGSSIVIPPQSWRELLVANRGNRIALDVYARGDDGHWTRFDAIHNDVAQEEIDSHLAYRLIGPVCASYHDMGIYQRNLETFHESPILTYEAAGVCMNCHTFQNNRPDLFSFQIRPEKKEHKPGMILVRNGHAQRLTTPAKALPRPPGYTSWHPGGPVAAFALVHPRLYYRAVGADVRDVIDSSADLAAVNIESGAVSTSPAIQDPNRLETFPTWSADGKILYYVSARQPWEGDQPTSIEEIKLKYDLMSVQYDIKRDRWGQPKTVLSASDTGMSITEPRASPDGRYLLFCMADYGTFPVYRPSSDLYLMDLKSGKYRRLECNSNQSESWHCWSSNSRWIVFSSKRDNGLLARPYFSYVDSQGREHKPFVLPQKDPTFYDTWLKTYNVPELISQAVVVPQEELVEAIRAKSATADKPHDSTPTDGSPHQDKPKY
jgi:hypothetical protein